MSSLYRYDGAGYRVTGLPGSSVFDELYLIYIFILYLIYIAYFRMISRMEEETKRGCIMSSQ